MGSPMPKISWRCKNQTRKIESDSDSDETYYSGSPSGIKGANATVDSITTFSDILNQGLLSQKITTNNKVKCSSSVNTQSSDMEWIDSRSSREEAPSTNSGSGRHLSWKDPIASSCKISSKGYAKPYSRGDTTDTQLRKLHTWIIKTDSRLTSSLISGGQPLTCDEAERMLRKTKQCLKQLPKMRRAPEKLITDMQHIGEKIVNRVMKKMKEISDQQLSFNVAPSNNHSSLQKSSQMTNDFTPKTLTLKTDLQDGCETAKLRYEGDTNSRNQVTKTLQLQSSQMQMTTKEFTLSQNFREKKPKEKPKKLHSLMLSPKKIEGIKSTQSKNLETLHKLTINLPEINEKSQNLKETTVSPSLLEKQGATELENYFENQSEIKNKTETQSEFEGAVKTPSKTLPKIQENVDMELEMGNSFRMESESQNAYSTPLYQGSSDMFTDSDLLLYPKILERFNKATENETKGQDTEVISSKDVGYEISAASMKSLDDKIGAAEINRKTMQLEEFDEIHFVASAESLSVDKKNEGVKALTNVSLAETLTSQQGDFSQDFIEDSQPVKFESIQKGRKLKSLGKKKSSMEDFIGNGTSLSFSNGTKDFVAKKPVNRRPSTSEEKIFKKAEKSVLKSEEKAIENEKRCRGVLDASVVPEAKNFQKNAEAVRMEGSSFPKREKSWKEKQIADSSLEVSPQSSAQILFDDKVLPGNFMESRMETDLVSYRQENVTILPIAEKLYDHQCILLEKNNEAQKDLTENVCSRTNDLSFTGTLQNVQGIDVTGNSKGTKGSQLNNIVNKENISALSLTPEMFFPIEQTSTEIVEISPTRIDEFSSPLLFGDRMEISSDKPLETVITLNAEDRQSFTQMLLEDSQEITDTQLASMLENLNTIKQTEEAKVERNLPLKSQDNVINIFAKPNVRSNVWNHETLMQAMLDGTQERSDLIESLTENGKGEFCSTQSLLQDSQEMGGTQLATEIVKPSIKLTDEINVEEGLREENSNKLKATFKAPMVNPMTGDNQSLKFLESSQDKPLNPEKIKISLFKSTGAIPKVSPICLVTKSGEEMQNSLSFTTKSTMVVQKPNRESNKSELLQQKLNKFTTKIVQERQLDLENIAQKVSSQTFGIKSQKLMLQQVSKTKPVSSKSKANAENIAITSEETGKKFVQLQILEKKGTKRPLQDISNKNQNSSTEISKLVVKPNFVPTFQDAQNWPPKFVKIIQYPLIVANSRKNSQTDVNSTLKPNQVTTNHDLSSTNSQTNKVTETTPMNSDVPMIRNEHNRCYGLPMNQSNIQIAPNFTAMDVELPQVQPNTIAFPRNLETGNRNKTQAKGFPELTSGAKGYEYFVATPMDAMGKLNFIGNQEVLDGNAFEKDKGLPRSGIQEGNTILNKGSDLNSKIIQEKSTDSTPRVPIENEIYGQRFTFTVQNSSVEPDSKKPTEIVKNQDILTSKEERFETFDSLILKMFDYENVVKRREKEGRNSVGAGTQSSQNRLEQNTCVLKPPEAQKSPSFLSQILFPTNVDPARAAERDMILSLTHVRTRTPRDFAPKNEKISEFLRKPFTWENIPEELLKDLEDSDED